MRRTNTKKSNMRNPVPLREDGELESLCRGRWPIGAWDFAGRVNKLDRSRWASWNREDISRNAHIYVYTHTLEIRAHMDERSTMLHKTRKFTCCFAAFSSCFLSAFSSEIKISMTRYLHPTYNDIYVRVLFRRDYILLQKAWRVTLA